MPNAGDIQLESRGFFLFIGDYDAGKSTAAASFPGRKYFMDFDGRIVSLRGRKDVDFDNFATTTTGFGEADKAIDKLVAKSKSNSLEYDLVCLDSISMGRRLLLYDSMKHTTTTKGGKDAGRKIGQLNLPTMQDYGYEAEALWQLVADGLKALKCHVVVTGHTVDKFKKEQAYEGGPVSNVPDGKMIYGDPKLIAVLPVLFTEIYHFTKEDRGMGARRYVEFDGDVARTTYPQLRKVKKVEIPEGKGFYDVWSELLKGA
jgi:hypothetical protein